MDRIVAHQAGRGVRLRPQQGHFSQRLRDDFVCGGEHVVCEGTTRFIYANGEVNHDDSEGLCTPVRKL